MYSKYIPIRGDEMKSTKVHPVVKGHLEKLKDDLGLKSESEVIDYLVLFRATLNDKITLNQHLQIKDVVKTDHGQVTLF